MDEATMRQMAAAVEAAVTASREGAGRARASAQPATTPGLADARRIDAELWACIEARREALT